MSHTYFRFDQPCILKKIISRVNHYLYFTKKEIMKKPYFGKVCFKVELRV